MVAAWYLWCLTPQLWNLKSSWLLMATDGYWWLLMATDGYWWLLMATDGYWWLLMATDGYWWLLIKSVSHKPSDPPIPNSWNLTLKGALLIFLGAFLGSWGVQLWKDTGDKLKASSWVQLCQGWLMLRDLPKTFKLKSRSCGVVERHIWTCSVVAFRKHHILLHSRSFQPISESSWLVCGLLLYLKRLLPSGVLKAFLGLNPTSGHSGGTSNESSSFWFVAIPTQWWRFQLRYCCQ